MVHACIPAIQEVEAGGLKAQGQPGPQSKTLSPNKQTNEQTTITEIN
jgi:hypothetical protein